jgi:HK97 family phage prohead protease
MATEVRMVHQPVLVRKSETEPTTLDGYAAVFRQETVIGDYFRETIEPGAFASAIKGADVRGLFNHDPNHVLGRTASKTMQLIEDETGLRYVIKPPDTTLGRDVMALVERGDITGSSFGFTVKRDSWTRPSKPGELPLRTIHEVDWLRDVGPVTFPAYEETSVSARDAASAAAVPEPVGDFEALSRFKGEVAVLEAECA